MRGLFGGADVDAALATAATAVESYRELCLATEGEMAESIERGIPPESELVAKGLPPQSAHEIPDLGATLAEAVMMELTQGRPLRSIAESIKYVARRLNVTPDRAGSVSVSAGNVEHVLRSLRGRARVSVQPVPYWSLLVFVLLSSAIASVIGPVSGVLVAVGWIVLLWRLFARRTSVITRGGLLALAGVAATVLGLTAGIAAGQPDRCLG